MTYDAHKNKQKHSPHPLSESERERVRGVAREDAECRGDEDRGGDGRDARRQRRGRSLRAASSSSVVVKRGGKRDVAKALSFLFQFKKKLKREDAGSLMKKGRAREASLENLDDGAARGDARSRGGLDRVWVL